MKGGKRPNAGRPRLSQDEKTVAVPIRLTESQRDKLKALGGPAWIRQTIDSSNPRDA